jgi:hypothetical protein
MSGLDIAMEAIFRVLSEDRRRFRRLPLWGKSSRCRLPYQWTCQFRAWIGFAGFLGIAPQETLSGSMHDRKSHAHARISIDSPKAAKIGGLNGGGRSLELTRLCFFSNANGLRPKNS